MSKKTGGPAFPQRLDGWNQVETGMTLRDYFAAKALAGGLEQGVRDDMDLAWWRDPEDVARRAYAVADAMIAEREK